MYPRTQYEMSNEDRTALLERMKPVPYMIIGGRPTASRQENVNAAWAALGAKMGFDSETVRPIPGKPDRFFSAVPSETPEQKEAREAQAQHAARVAEIDRLEKRIAEDQCRLQELKRI